MRDRAAGLLGVSFGSPSPEEFIEMLGAVRLAGFALEVLRDTSSSGAVEGAAADAQWRPDEVEPATVAASALLGGLKQDPSGPRLYRRVAGLPVSASDGHDTGNAPAAVLDAPPDGVSLGDR